MTETFRWKARFRRVLGVLDLLEDADGSRRMEAEGGWLAVVYPPDHTRAYLETVERAEVRREFIEIPAGKSTAHYVSGITIDSLVGRLDWTAYDSDRHRPAQGTGVQTYPQGGVLRGRLRLPDGSIHETDRGSGLFESAGLCRAFMAWRDTDLSGEWAVVTEVESSAPEELRPLLAALPLLLFTLPPTV